MQRPVRPQDHRELLRLAVAEITHAPEGAWNARVINRVCSGDPNSLAQKFVHNRVGDVHEDRSVVIRIGIQAPLAQDLIGLHAGGFRVDGELQVLANGLRIQTPDQSTSNKHAHAKEGDHSRGQGLVPAWFDFKSSGLEFARDSDFRIRLRTIEQVLISFEPVSRQIRRARKSQGRERGSGHDRSGNFEVQAIRTNQQQPDQQRIHGVMPDERRDDAPAEHHHSRYDSDNPNFDSADVRWFLRVIAVQKAPEKCRHDHGDPPRTREPQEKRNGEQAERKLLVQGSEKPDCKTGNPREQSVHAVRIVQLLRRPGSQPRRHQVEGHKESNVCGGKTQSHDGSGEKFFRTQPAHAENPPQAQLVRLRAAVERLRRGQDQRDRERGRGGNQQCASDLQQEKAPVRRLRVVLRSPEGPVVQRLKE